VLKLIENADVDLEEAVRGYRALGDELSRCDAVAASARSRIAKAGTRLPAAARKQLDRLDREALRARASLGLAEPAQRRGRALRAAIVAVSVAVIGFAAVTLVGIVSGLGVLPTLAVVRDFEPLNPITVFLNSFGCCSGHLL
jgi:hypothetical protein